MDPRPNEPTAAPPVPERARRSERQPPNNEPFAWMRTKATLVFLGALSLIAVLSLVGTLGVLVPQMERYKRRGACMTAMQRAAALWEAARERHETLDEGTAFGALVRWHREQPCLGDGEFLRCPADPDALPAGTPVNWNKIDPANPPAGVCSWAVRDLARFPIDRHSEVGEIIAACTHHRGGVMLARTDGSAAFADWRALGLPPDGAATIGPGSPSPILKMVVALPGAK